jgi:phage terminase small subunit
MNLSIKHKAFCDEFLSNGLNQVQAYKSVYKCSDKAAQSNATRLMENEGVKSYIQQQQEKTAERLEITKEGLLQDLIQIKENNIETRPATAMKAIEIINKMSGFDAPIKQDITITEQPLFLDKEEEE